MACPQTRTIMIWKTHNWKPVTRSATFVFSSRRLWATIFDCVWGNSVYVFSSEYIPYFNSTVGLRISGMFFVAKLSTNYMLAIKWSYLLKYWLFSMHTQQFVLTSWVSYITQIMWLWSSPPPPYTHTHPPPFPSPNIYSPPSPNCYSYPDRNSACTIHNTYFHRQFYKC